MGTLAGCVDATPPESPNKPLFDARYKKLQADCTAQYPLRIGAFKTSAKCQDAAMFVWGTATDRDVTMIKQVNAQRDRLADVIDRGGIPLPDATAEFERFGQSVDKLLWDSHGNGSMRHDADLRMLLGAKGLPSGNF